MTIDPRLPHIRPKRPGAPTAKNARAALSADLSPQGLSAQGPPKRTRLPSAVELEAAIRAKGHAKDVIAQGNALSALPKGKKPSPRALPPAPPPVATSLPSATDRRAPPPDPREQLTQLLPNLRAFAISLSRNVALADDIVQETILKAWSNMDKFDPHTNLEAWLFTIVRNTFYSFLRKTRREVQDTDGNFAASLSHPPAHDARLAYNDFERAFSKLSPEHREVLILIGASGYSVEEAARMMSVAPGTVKSRASRARKRLAELLGLAEGESMVTAMDKTTAAVVGRNVMDTPPR